MASLKKHYEKKVKQSLKNRMEEESDDLLNFEDDMDDDQYLELLRGSDTKKQKKAAHDWEKDPKYKGDTRQKKNKIEDDDESIDSENIPEFDEDAEFKEETKVQRTNQKLKSKIKSKNSKGALKDELGQMEEQDAQILQQQKINKQEIADTTEQLKEQINLWANLVENRQSYQKYLDMIKQLPIQNEAFVNKLRSDGDSSILNQISIRMLTNIDKLNMVINKLYPIDNIESGALDLEQQQKQSEESILINSQIGETIERFHTQIEDRMNNDIVKWSSKTSFLNNLNRKQIGNAIDLQTPIGQTKKALQNKV